MNVTIYKIPTICPDFVAHGKRTSFKDRTRHKWLFLNLCGSELVWTFSCSIIHHVYQISLRHSLDSAVANKGCVWKCMFRFGPNHLYIPSKKCQMTLIQVVYALFFFFRFFRGDIDVPGWVQENVAVIKLSRSDSKKHYLVLFHL